MRYMINDRIQITDIKQLLYNHTGTVIGYNENNPIGYIIKIDRPVKTPTKVIKYITLTAEHIYPY